MVRTRGLRLSMLALSFTAVGCGTSVHFASEQDPVQIYGPKATNGQFYHYGDTPCDVRLYGGTQATVAATYSGKIIVRTFALDSGEVRFDFTKEGQPLSAEDANVLSHRVSEGMSSLAVRRAWGEPHSASTGFSSGKSVVFWHWNYGSTSQTVMFIDDKVVSVNKTSY